MGGPRRLWVDGVELTRGFYGIDVACRERMDEVTKLVVGDPGEAGSVRIVIRQEVRGCDDSGVVVAI